MPADEGENGDERENRDEGENRDQREGDDDRDGNAGGRPGRSDGGGGPGRGEGDAGGGPGGGNREGEGESDGEAPKIPGLWMTEERLEYVIERNRALVERGLALQDRYAEAMEDQEAARERREEAARARGETAPFEWTPEERAWQEWHDRNATGIGIHHKGVLRALGLDPRRSALFAEFPVLMTRACDPQCPVIYQPEEREFALMETWGPAILVIDHCPWTGKALPKSLAEEWTAAVDAFFGTDAWEMDEARRKLPEAYWTEAWWIARGL